jgi:hypothetical protein
MSFAVVLAFGVSAMAHHSLTGTYDYSKTITLSGTIAKVSWTNPHSAFTIDTRDPADGKTVQWIFTTISASCMERQGIARESVAVGMAVTVRNAPVAKNGTRLGFLRGFSDGGKNEVVVEPGRDTNFSGLELKSIFDRRPAPRPTPSPGPLATFPPRYDPDELGHCFDVVSARP